MSAMPFVHSTINRRALLAGGASCAAAALAGAAPSPSEAVKQIELTAAPGRWQIVGGAHPATDVWRYDAHVPGPELRIRPGEPVRIVMRNRLLEDTTVHWHGIRLPNAMDGVPGLTQPPIKPGENFVYAFTPPDADFYDGLSYSLTQLAYDHRPPLRAHPDPVISLPRNPLPEPDLASAERHEVRLQGGMMGGGGMMGTGHAASWAINGMSMTGDGDAGMWPLFTLRRGRISVLTLRNETAWWHPMHLHGHSFRVLSRDGAPAPHRAWADTVLMRPKEAVEIAFVAGNPATGCCIATSRTIRCPE
jgi:FtsP/CotA-like multicopper oxidase with cupredoxin domain